MLHIYNNENEDGEKRCGYFDPLTTHGGPQLNQPVSLVFLFENRAPQSHKCFLSNASSIFSQDLNEKKQTRRREYLKEKNDEDKRGARHLLEQKYGIDSESMKRPVIHERRMLGELLPLTMTILLRPHVCLTCRTLIQPNWRICRTFTPN